VSGGHGITIATMLAAARDEHFMAFPTFDQDQILQRLKGLNGENLMRPICGK
jgi:hypothetical protein